MTDYVGAPDAPSRLAWDDVRRILRSQARMPRGRAGFTSFEPGRLQEAFTTPKTQEIVDEASLFDAVATAADAAAALATETDPSEHRRRAHQIEAGFAARRALIDAYLPLVDQLVSQFVISADTRAHNVREAVLVGLGMAMEKYATTRRATFKVFATWWIRQEIVAFLTEPQLQ